MILVPPRIRKTRDPRLLLFLFGSAVPCAKYTYKTLALSDRKTLSHVSTTYLSTPSTTLEYYFLLPVQASDCGRK